MLLNIVEHFAAKETNIFLSWWGPKPELKER